MGPKPRLVDDQTMKSGCETTLYASAIAMIAFCERVVRAPRYSADKLRAM